MSAGTQEHKWRHWMLAASVSAGMTLAGCASGGGSGPVAAVPAAGEQAGASPAETYATPIPAGQIDAAVARLDDVVAQVMRRSRVPGMAVAVVRDGKTIYAKGFGVRRAGSPERVDANTVFQLASMSKSIGATVVAGAVGRGTVSWDTPVVTAMPAFRLSGDWISQNVTVADFYSHRSGLSEHVGDQLEDLGYDRAEVLRRLRFMPLQSPRTIYTYTNFGLTAGAEAVATAAGLDWATLSDRTLYQPLGMSATSSRFADFMQRGNRAFPHVLSGGRYQPLYQRQPDAQSPAGGVSSSANDVARWMSFVMQNGAYEGRQVVKADALLPAIKPHMAMPSAPNANARTSFYGYGFIVGTSPAGRVKLSHSGGFMLGAGTAFSMIPAAGVAIVTLTNAAPVGAAEAVNAAFDDLVEAGRITRDWLPAYEGLMRPMFAPEGSLVGQQPPARPAAPRARNAYTGTYASSYYGHAVVEDSGGGLVLKMGPGGAKSFVLRHWSGNTFVIDLSGENAPPGSISRIDFKVGPSGRSESVQMEYFSQDIARGVFTRAP
jgi:CubicO group peptidase (beta-lactamase class C family)